MIEQKPATILNARELILILGEMVALTPCADCVSEPALVADGEDAGSVVLTHNPTCPAMKARR